MASPFTTFPIPATFAVSEWGLAVNVKDFGAVGNNVADDTAAIQAAIDYALANDMHEVFIPSGDYKITTSLFMDPPPPAFGLRAGGSWPPTPNPTPICQFSLTLSGAIGLPNQEGDGTDIRPTFNDKVAIYVGAGNGMKLANLSITGPGGAYKNNQNANGVGVGLTGTGCGSSRVTIENVGVFNFYTGFKTSANGNGTLGDSNTFIKCFTGNVFYGFWINGQQNFINSFYDCNPNNSGICLYAPFGQGCHVFGGNWSNNAGLGHCLPLSAISAVTASSAGSFFDYSFTGTVNAVGDIGFGPSNTAALNSCAIKTARFGVIPLFCTAFTGTPGGIGTATFAIMPFWANQHFAGVNAVTDTDMQAEIQACTILYCAERVTTFWGNGISVKGVHVENANAAMTLIRCSEAFGSNNPGSYSDIYFNVDPSMWDLRNEPDPSNNYALYVIQQAWPFIWLESTGGAITLENSQLGVGHSEAVTIVVQGIAQDLVTRNLHAFGLNNILCIAGNSYYVEPGGVYITNSAGFGAGHFGSCLTFSNAPKEVGDYWRQTSAWGSTPFIGRRPAPWTRPVITPDQLTRLVGPPTPPSTSGPGIWSVNYPPIWGGQIHSVVDAYRANTVQYEIVSDHHFYSYGVNMTTTQIPSLSLTYKGQSPVVYADQSTLELVFPGLGVILSDGVSDTLCQVLGVYKALGYFSVVGQTGGTKNVVYLPATNPALRQEPFAISVVSGPIIPVTKTADFTVAPLERSLIVNQAATTTVTLPSASLYPGRSLTIKTVQAQLVNSAASNVVPQIGGAAGTAILAATAGKWAELQSSGSNWIIVQSN